MAEPVDAGALKASFRKEVRVRVPLPATPEILGFFGYCGSLICPLQLRLKQTLHGRRHRGDAIGQPTQPEGHATPLTDVRKAFRLYLPNHRGRRYDE